VLQNIHNTKITIFLFCFFMSAPLALASPKIENKPNIVLINMDNFGYGEPGGKLLSLNCCLMPVTRRACAGRLIGK